jgi:hypothetical protein
MSDFIPRKGADLVTWSANFTAKVIENASEWSIPEEEVNSLKTATAEFAALHAQADSPVKNMIIVAKKNAARTALITEIRKLAGFRLRNPIITDTQRTALGLHVHDATQSNIPVPKSRPEFEIDVLDIRLLKVTFRDLGKSGRAKPYGVSGAIIAYEVLDAPPAGTETLARTVLATRTPHILEFLESDRGKTVYIALRWQNQKGERGPWSEILKAIIP